MPELFLEIRSQELAARDLEPLLKRLLTGLFEELTSRGFDMKEVHTGATPRRLAIGITGLPEHEPDSERNHIGPSADAAYDEDGRPTEALEGFCRRLDVSVDDITEIRTERGLYTAWVENRQGISTAEALTEMIPRHMRESSAKARSSFGSEYWPRPLTGLTALMDGEPLELALEGHSSQAQTVGHPAHGAKTHGIANWSSWITCMKEDGIVPSLEERRKQLVATLKTRAEELGAEPVLDPKLLRQLAASTAVPTWILGRLSLPPDSFPEPLWIAALAERGRAVALRSPDGLLPYFMTVVDRPDEDLDAIVTGFERAVGGHLSDAAFAYGEDQRIPLAQRVRRLEQLTYHPRLGTWAEKSRRLRAMVEPACAELEWDDALESAMEAAGLLKADLATSVGREFPSLKGTMGGLYARQEGYVEKVWQGIHDHYRPVSEDGPIPRSRTGQVLAVADRLETLVGFFGIGERLPDRKRDPHGLRPTALGLLRILIEGNMSLDLDLLAARAVRLYGAHLDQGTETILKQLQTFLDRRLDHLLGLRGFHQDEIEAVKAVGTRDLPDLYRRLQALRRAQEEKSFGDLVSAAKRITNIIVDFPETELDVELLTEEAEIHLHQRTVEVQEKIQGATGEDRYEKTLLYLLALVPALDTFFADVLVMDEDERRRANRMALLQNCRRLYWKVARLNAMEADRWGESDSSTTT